MAYKALYRTYRPLTFEEVAGQKHIVRTLQNALEQQKTAHAYLFTGPRGTGKTTMAKLMAKALNCEEGIGHQCNECANCIAINEGSHPDVIEIDAASNNGVEDVRDLIDRVKYSPMRGRYKVYIIDEVHMMSASAFNALLKTLEEPPSHVVFILATTEPHKVLPTILSRCQRYDFTKVSEKDIETRMHEVLERENVVYDKEAIDLIISLADGGVRDALSLLDQSIAYAGKSLHVKDLEELFGLAGVKERKHLLMAIMEGDYHEVLAALERFVEHGVDIRRLSSDLLIMLKDLLIYRKTKDPSLLVQWKNEDLDELPTKISTKRLLEWIDILLAMQSEFKTVPNLRSLFEITLLKMTSLQDQTELTSPDETPLKETPLTEPEVIIPSPKVALESEKPQLEVTPVIEKPVPEVQKVEQATPTMVSEELPPFLKRINDEVKDVPPLESTGDQNHLDDDEMIKIMVCGKKEEKQQLQGLWPSLNKMIFDPRLGKYASLLKDGMPYILCKEILVLQYDYQNLAEKVNIQTNQKPIREIVSRMLGRDIAVYALSRSEAVRLYAKYQNLYQVGKLPRIDQIVLDIHL